MSDLHVTTPPTRSIGALLMLGLIILPIVFYWFLWRRGYSTAARIGAGVYLLLGLALWIVRITQA
ncbi:hypothetical protein E2E30_17910 [Sphingomonas sp. AAP5]|uniref:hypothetical protein n=1 Tax=unclassified Sphingomonas TaxID=196159 RepID=UPI001057367D|nr:hypothetical protein [Sphingomonas sp. AAP5]QBM77436.1 hypothetical protein E2E30_17910 [Sphingomonas sp. AAP5]